MDKPKEILDLEEKLRLLKDEAMVSDLANEEYVKVEKKLQELNSPAYERSWHPEGKYFEEFFTNSLVHTRSCFERDILRDNKNHLWESWKKRAIEYDAKFTETASYLKGSANPDK